MSTAMASLAEQQNQLLASVPAAKVEACVAALKALGYVRTAVIGRILEQGAPIEPISLKF